MKEYQSHKRVFAAKISRIDLQPVDQLEGDEGQRAVLYFEDSPMIYVPAEYILKHDPQVGGYYVQYHDGYESFSPSEPFEEGYSLLEGAPEPCEDGCAVNPVSVDDPWAHRSAGMRCGSCMWYVAKTGTTSGIGRCRRHCPTMSGYPVVYLHDWCGDHKLDERKA